MEKPFDQKIDEKINSEILELGRNLRKEIKENEIAGIKEQIADTRRAILTVIEALARVAHSTPHLTQDEQTKIKQLLGIG